MNKTDLNYDALLAHFERQLQYHHMAQQRVIDLLLRNPHVEAELLKLVSHNINAHLVWVSRLLADDQPFTEVWKVYEASGLPEAEALCQKRWTAFFATQPDFSHKIRYQNTQGQVFENTTEDIITHVFMHAVYHRGQIAMRLRQSGIEPVSTDFISFARGQFG